MGIYTSITELVGRTPMLRLEGLGGEAEIVVKLESFNPASSVKDRIGLAMIKEAEKSGALAPGGTIVEATSGNTGIALAFVGASTGHPVVLTMPDTMSIERRRLLEAFGARLVLTPGAQGMRGAVERAEEIHRELPGSFMTSQFENQANPEIHRQTTAVEIWDDCQQQVDAFVAGVGTGGTFTGAGGRLKELNPNLHLVAVEPVESPVLAGGQPGPHKIQGIGAGFIPGVMKKELADEILSVSAADAGNMSRRLASEFGVLAGISAGANVHVATQLAARPEFRGKRIVTVICDTGERYLSTWLFGE